MPEDRKTADEQHQTQRARPTTPFSYQAPTHETDSGTKRNYDSCREWIRLVIEFAAFLLLIWYAAPMPQCSESLRDSPTDYRASLSCSRAFTATDWNEESRSPSSATWSPRLGWPDSASVQAVANQDAANAAAVAAHAAASQAATAQTALELSERPWLAIDNPILAEPPKWQILREFKGRPPLNLEATITYRLNNFGKSPAIRTFASAEAAFPEHEAEKRFGKPIRAMHTLCALNDAMSRDAAKPSSFDEGEAIFPQTPVNRTLGSSNNLPDIIKTIDHIWIVACVAYQDKVSVVGTIHHTKLWFRSIPNDPNGKPQPIARDQAVTWKQFASFELWDSEAD